MDCGHRHGADPWTADRSMMRFVVEPRKHWASQLISIGSDLPRVISGQLQIQPMCAE